VGYFSLHEQIWEKTEPENAVDNFFHENVIAEDVISPSKAEFIAIYIDIYFVDEMEVNEGISSRSNVKSSSSLNYVL
jgi:hypothetical protein